MITHIISIGNSKGVRIPKAILEQCGFKDDVSMTVKDHTLILASYKENPRKGWEKKFQQMAQRGDDDLLDPPILDHSWDKEEWEW
ncbi:MAG: hypothetical protein BGO67_07585 [Alphaproteobacteria bacterium 41-28]|nr:MAG: hypothetical protein BGO67_07585 [Alphaproteobacteria bacterium 41-28]